VASNKSPEIAAATKRPFMNAIGFMPSPPL
jgi:hypothetical protein